MTFEIRIKDKPLKFISSLQKSVSARLRKNFSRVFWSRPKTQFIQLDMVNYA